MKAILADGKGVELVFCDVFLMRGGKVRQLTSYLVQAENTSGT